MAKIVVATTQMAYSSDAIEKAGRLVKQAAQQGAQVIALQELFYLPYFPKDQSVEWFKEAILFDPESEFFHKMSQLARSYKVVLPISFFEKDGSVYYNSSAIIDANGDVLGVYRKTHIPQNPGYNEKFYFSPGNTGYMVWDTAYCQLGVAICWDQWFPYVSAAMVSIGAELLIYPTAIGSEPSDPAYDSKSAWEIAMRGQAAMNKVPIIAANRIGAEQGSTCSINFYGSSFITDEEGNLLSQMDRSEEGFTIAEIDLQKVWETRDAWGLARDNQLEF